MKIIPTKRINELRQIFNETRIKILVILSKDSATVAELVKTLKIKNNLLSHHLKVLKSLGYVKSTRTGQHFTYSLVPAKRIFIKKLLLLIGIK